MVRLAYENQVKTEEVFDLVKQSAYGHQACTVMILVAHEVDAMSACKMLTRMLMFDNVAYTVRSVANEAQIRESLKAIGDGESIKTVFMVNCGATMNLPKELNMDYGGEVRVIVMDNHRPFHLKNIYSEHNVVVMDYQASIDHDEKNGFIPGDVDSDIENIQDNDEDTTDDDSDDEDDDSTTDDGSVKSVSSDVGRDDGDEVADSVGEEANMFDDDSIATDDGADGGDEMEKDDGVRDGEDGIELGSTPIDGDMLNGQGTGIDADADGEGDASGGEKGVGDKVDEEKDKQEGDTSYEKEDQEEEDDDDDEENRALIRRRKREDVDPAVSKRKKLKEYIRRNPSVEGSTAWAMTAVASTTTNKQRFNQDFYWQAILGITDQFLRGNLLENYYNWFCDDITQKIALVATNETKANAADFRVARGVDPGASESIRQAQEQATINVRGSEAGRVEESRHEFRFYLYRHWSLYDAMHYSPYVASKMAVWKTHGSFKLQELLAKLGMPLQECKQNYTFMNPELRKSFRDQLLATTLDFNADDDDDNAPKSITSTYNLKNPGVFFRSFVRYNSFRNRVSAADVVHAASALVEWCKQDAFDEDDTSAEDARLSSSSSIFSGLATNSQLDAFNDAYDCLSMQDDILKRGITAAKALQKIVVRQATSMLGSPAALVRFPSFYYGKITLKPGANPVGHSSAPPSSSGSGGLDAEDDIEDPLCRPMVVSRLGHFIMNVQRENTRWVKGNAKPLIIASERKHSWLIVHVACPESAWNPDNVKPEEWETKEPEVKNPNFRKGFASTFAREAKDQDMRFRNDSLDSAVMEVGKDIDVDQYIYHLVEA